VKILYISQYFPPEIAAPAVRVSELSRHWVAGGHEVTVLTGFPNHPSGIIPPDYKKRLWRFIFRESMDGVNVVRTWLWPRPNRKAFGRMLSFLSFTISAGISGLFLSRPDVVIATSPQPLVGLNGWWLARAKRVPFVFEVRDLWPESLSAVGMGDERSVLHRVVTWIAKFLYRQSDKIVVVTPAFKTHLVKSWSVPSEKVSVVENGVETELFRPDHPVAQLKRELAGGKKFLACYIGTIGMAHGLETLLEAAAHQDALPEWGFVLVGDGAEKERIASRAASMGLSNLRVIDAQPRRKIPSYICASDACLVLLKRTPVFETVIPTKMLEFMSCGRPVILGVEGQAKSILQEAQAGICVEPENSAQLIEALKRLAADRSLQRTLGENGRQYILRSFSREKTAAKYLRVLREI
jgi:colanic acid biosynthesis glycosyl transferase WcaI